MLLKTKGLPHLINHPIVGKVTRNHSIKGENYILIGEEFIPETNIFNFVAILTNLPLSDQIDKASVYGIPDFCHLNEEDIIVVNQDGIINTLYRAGSHHNFLLATERCNSNCLMCSQPPKNKEDGNYLFDIYQQLIPLIPKNCVELGITGGEPTLLGEKFFRLLELIKHNLPDTEVHCLTNGRSFAWANMAGRLEQIGYNRLMLGIPLYSDYYHMHDYVVQAKDAFHQTMQGLYRLASFDQRLEIRIVLHKQTIPRLTKLAKYIYKNLPFVEHVTFMGLEYQGYTPYNIEKLWIDPTDYMQELQEAVEYLSVMGMNVSIYNSQLCILPKELWKFNRKSISDWKNIYLDECNRCSLRDECGGLFASCQNMHSRNLRAIF
jgi:His-Xaa-Ser system radical SAM maturase HxsC